MNIRELYVFDMQGRCNHDIDTGFGLSSGAGRGVGGGETPCSQLAHVPSLCVSLSLASPPSIAPRRKTTMFHMHTWIKDR